MLGSYSCSTRHPAPQPPWLRCYPPQPRPRPLIWWHTHLLVLAGVHVGGIAGRGLRDDTGSSDKRVREGGLAVIDVSDHRHRTDVLDLVLDHLELGDGKVHLRAAGRVSVALNE